jgi:glyoxylase-like metal-dependent hydrolase (beta-lactamase superfamily II)
MTAAEVWHEVGDGCFHRRYRSLDLGIGVVRSPDGLLVIDTRSHDGEADQLLADLTLLGGPVQIVVNSHWHYDHVFGNDRFHRQAADPQHGRVAVRPDLPVFGHWRLPELLATYGELVREYLIKAAVDHDPDQAKALEAVQITPPEWLVTELTVLDLGGRPIELRHLGAGHTGGDLVVLVPDAEVAFAGDLVEQSGPPALGDDCYPISWPGTLQGLLALLPERTVVLPGHGAPVDLHFVRRQADDLSRVAQLIAELHATGVPVDDALAAGGAGWALPTEALLHAVRRGYAQLDGALP